MENIMKNLKLQYDEIVSIEYIGEKETIDINTDGDRLFYCNDILVHNSAIDESEHSQSMMAGGISKVNTADNVISIITSPAMRERGEYAVQFLKTRSSAGVGRKVYLSFDMKSLRIGDLSDDPVRHQINTTDSLRDDNIDRSNVTHNSALIAALKREPTTINNSNIKVLNKGAENNIIPDTYNSLEDMRNKGNFK